MHTFWKKLKLIVSHHHVLELTLIISFLAFTINPGSLGFLMMICGLLFLFNLLIGQYRITNFSRGHIALLVIFLIILLINFTMPSKMVHDSSLRYFLYVPGTIMAIHCLALKLEEKENKFFYSAAATALLIAVIAQLIGYYYFKNEKMFGFYGNRHHLGLFCSLTIPPLWYFYIRSKGWLRLLFMAGGLVNFYLFWESSSRVSWISFFIAIFLTSILFFKIKHLVIGILGVLLISSFSIFISGHSHVKNRIFDLATNWKKDERAIIWPDTLRMLNDNSLKDWALGHGIGSFRYYYPKYCTYPKKINKQKCPFHFPHNIILQILFENGLSGFILILGGFGLLFFNLWKGFHRLESLSDRYMLITSFALLLINLITCFLNKSFYSKYVLYSFSLIIGVSMMLIDKTSHKKLSINLKKSNAIK